MEIEYINEHLLPGKIGHFLILLGFVSTMLSALAYFFAEQRKDLAEANTWKTIGRTAFRVHGISIITVMAIIFYIMINEYYEYNYVLQHVSSDLDFKYIFSAFWEGQEGSFLLWMFWHIILGFILTFKKGRWEAPVMAIIALVQVFICSFVTGVQFPIGQEGFALGISPLLLLRDTMDAPIFMNPNYTALIQGNGLNPLLQNYWMTIHPPTLFLGFASTIVPFAFAMAGLWTKDYQGWLKPSMPWALFSGAILGTGIMMGGAWAYEALSFGGYWAWDPVENMSLVPWIILVAGLHTALVAQKTGFSYKSTFLFYMFAFVFILYSTFLTRSGILGDTSVHAFTEMGLEFQLAVFVIFFAVLSLVMFFKRRKDIPSPKEEEHIWSREFWMFIGALVLLFSAVLITFTTSIPVYNKIILAFGDWFGIDWSDRLMRPPDEPVSHYNKYQLWIGVFVALLSGFTQFLRYKEPNFEGRQRNFVLIHSGVSLLLSIVIGYLMCSTAGINAWQYHLLMMSGVFAILINLDYLVSVLRGKIWVSGSVIAHLGFGLFLIGVIYSGAKKEVISKDFMSVGVIDGFDEDEITKNILLRKGLPTRMGNYLVTYEGDTLIGFTRTFNVNYKRFGKDIKIEEEFNLQPNILYNKALTKIETANPSTKHYLHKDIFTHITALPNSEVDVEGAKAAEDSLKYEQNLIEIGDTIYTSKHYVIFKGFNNAPKHKDYRPQTGDLAVGAELEIKKLETDSIWTAEPLYLIRNNFENNIGDDVKEIGLKFKCTKIDPASKKVTIEVAETKPVVPYIVLQAIVFPGINLVWLGSILCLLGLLIASLNRVREKRKLKDTT